MESSFSAAEYQRRLAAVRAEAEQQGLPLMLFFDPASICYLSGFSTINLWDIACLIVTHTDEPLLVMREFETGRFEASSFYRRCRPYGPEASAAEMILQVLAEFGPQRTIGLEMGRHLTAACLDTLRSRLPVESLRDCSTLMHSLRLVKSEEEITIMLRAAQVTDLGVRAGMEAAREGATDREVGACVNAALIAGGSDYMSIQPVVAAGRRSGIAHSTAAGVVLSDGDPVFLEIGAAVERYTSPLMRTTFVGKAPAQLQELMDYSSAALDAMIAIMRPGVPACDVAAAGHRALLPVLPRIAFHFVWGYSVGLSFPPSWLEETAFLLQSNNPRPLQAGMIFHLPLMLRIPGACGAGHSETVLITGAGAQSLSSVPRTIS